MNPDIERKEYFVKFMHPNFEKNPKYKKIYIYYFVKNSNTNICLKEIS